MLRRALALLAVFLAFSCALPDETHTEFPEVKVVLTPELEQTLAARYAEYQTRPALPEYAYCMTGYRVTRVEKEPVVEVYELTPAEVDHATPVSVLFDCAGFPYLHSHPPTDCDLTGKSPATATWDCVLVTEEDAAPRICIPSEQDLQMVREEWHRVGVIQCGTNRFLVMTAIY